MKIAIPATKDDINSLIDDRFARCSFFCLYDSETNKTEFLNNDLKDEAEGVGPQVVEFLATNGVKKVYAMEFGPKAKDLLDKLKLESIIISNKQTLNEIISLIKHSGRKKFAACTKPRPLRL